MRKRIAVEVNPDFIEKVARRTDPVEAIEELVWNGLDADATLVDADLELNDLGGVAAVVIRDNGLGIPRPSMERAFSGMGGSPKRDAAATLSGRQLHGRHGYGRFRVLALGSTARWTTVADDPEGRYRTQIDSSDGASAFEVTDLGECADAIGTLVRVTGEAQRKTRLLNDGVVRPQLTSRFAMYLVKYPGTVLRWRGVPLDPADAIDKEDSYPLFPGGVWGDSGEPPVLRIVEWKHRSAARELLVCDESGVHRLTLTPKIHAPDFHFTAYLVSDRFASLTEHDALEGEFESTDSPLGLAVEGVRAQLREHFRNRAQDRAREQVRKWMSEGVYPYAGASRTQGCCKMS